MIRSVEKRQEFRRPMKLEETLRSQRVFGDRSSRADQSESNRERVFNPSRAFRTSAIYLGSVKFFQTSTSTIETFTQRFSLLQFFFFFHSPLEVPLEFSTSLPKAERRRISGKNLFRRVESCDQRGNFHEAFRPDTQSGAT